MSFTYDINEITTLDSSPIEIIYTATRNIQGSIKARLVKSSTYGVVDLPGTEAPSTDLNDIKNSGDIKISIDSIIYHDFKNDFNLNNNGMSTLESNKFYLKFVPSNGWGDARRLYIGVEVFEAS